ncbi:MAG: saccharopine dehydrogenase NADP-binding domain-containing protein [Thaumarchaeota archaeon]|nr:saccharopine dehydrogenase NADP-binding domain-containing protein [Nitrososphaerota archaeon]
MKAGVLGSGMMGSVMARDLASSPEVDSVTVSDIDEQRLARLKQIVGGRKLSVETRDTKDRRKTADFLKGFDVVVSALPHGVVHQADLAAVDSGTKMVNIAFEDEQMELDSEARRNGALLIPGCGVAPGLGGILLSKAVAEIDADEGHILVGGVPQNPLPPFDYKLVFSIVGLLREYIDDARVFRDGKVVKVKPFSTLETVEFPEPVGKMEAFCTDGLASLVYTMGGMRVLDEKTLRWPGHVSKMNVLMDSGYFSKEKLSFGGAMVSPLEMSWAVLGGKLAEGDAKDMTVMRVIAKAGEKKIVFDMVDRYDQERGVTSMGKTTGYTGSIVAQMVGSGAIQGKGVLPPEIAVKGKLVGRLLSELSARGVEIRETRS